MNTAVSNNATKRCTKQNTTQPSLWDLPQDGPIALGIDPDDFAIRDVRFPWADGDTSPEATQRMLAQVTGQAHYLIDHTTHRGRIVWLFADVLSTWINNGVVCGRCKLYVGGPYVEELRSGQDVEEETDDEVV